MSSIINKKENNIWIHELISNIVNWHYDRNLIHGSSDKNQILKLVQEGGELAGNLADQGCIKDDIGDMFVVLINLAERNKVSATDCFTQKLVPLGARLDCPEQDEELSSCIEHFLNFRKESTEDLRFSIEMSSKAYLEIYCLVGHLSDVACKGKENLQIPIGKIMRGLVLLAECNNLTLEDCLERAWKDIRDRKGIMVDGVFVKEADLTKTN